MTKFTRLSKLFPNNSLMVNRTNSESIYDIMKFQPKGVLSYSSERGIHSNEPSYIEKVTDFINNVQERQPSLVVTPEGSIPFEVLKQIIENKSRWPDLYKLWGFCMEGIDKKDFKILVESYNIDDSLKVVIEDSITYRAHVNSLWYIFRIDEERLCIVIQLKNAPSSDRGIKYEARDLTTGNTIYVFDLNNGQPTKNTLISLICSDAIQLEPTKIITELEQSYPMIINHQCNRKPFDDRFKDFRNTILTSRSIKNQRYIVANWAKGSELKRTFTINESGNAYYNYLSVSGHPYLDKICSDKDSYSHRMEMQLLGVEYYASNKFNVWSYPDEENIMRFYIKKDEVFNVDESISTNFDPVIKECYKYNADNNCWESTEKNCILDNEEGSNNIYISEKEFLRPIKYKECEKRECENKCFWLYNDYFFATCFGNELKSELECKYEISDRTIATLSSEGLRGTQRKRELFKTLVKKLERNEIPKELPMFDDNLKFDIDINAAETGSNNIYNATVINVPQEYPNWGEKKGIFAIIDTADLSEVEIAYDKLYKMTKTNIRDQIVLYYRKDDDYISYKKPHEQSNITSKSIDFTNNPASIYKGDMQYE